MSSRRLPAIVLLILSGLLGLYQFLLLLVLHGAMSVDDLSSSLADYPPMNGNDHYWQTKQDNFSACLLVMDDNHFLIEWLAYNYQVLPLRRLIIAHDPRARTSPSEILQKWRDYIDITEWNDDDYFHPVLRAQILAGKLYNQSAAVAENRTIEDRFTSLHRHRQREFFKTCLSTLKAENQSTWVAMLDSDEFLTINRNYWKFRFMLPPDNHNNNTNPLTIAQILRRFGNYKTLSPACIGLPRLLFGTKEAGGAGESSGSTSSVQGINTSDFLTMRWKWHAPIHDFKFNKAGKTLVDVSRVPSNAFRVSGTNVHRPVKAHCQAEIVWTKISDSPIVSHHYIGSSKQWMFRHDPRGVRTKERYDSFQEVTHGMDESIQGWLQAFVHQVGPEAAKTLLSGVGHIEEIQSPRNESADMEMLLKYLPDISQPTNVTIARLT